MNDPRHIARLAHRIGRLIVDIVTFNMLRGRAPGTSHEEIRKLEVYRRLLGSSGNTAYDAGRNAFRLYEFSKVIIDRASQVWTAGIYTALPSGLLLQFTFAPESVFAYAIRIICLAGLCAILLGLMAASFASSLARYAASNLVEFDHLARKELALAEVAEVSPGHGQNGRTLLYLRAFDADVASAAKHGWLTEEEQLAKALNALGSLLAVGRPGEVLPEVGAKRVYFDHLNWQENVARLIASADLVVIRSGSTPGLLWEAEHLATSIPPTRLLIVGQTRSEVRRLTEVIRLAAIGRTQNRYMLRGPGIGSIKAAVIFDKDWIAQPLTLRAGTFLRLDEDGPLVERFRVSFAPLIKRQIGT